MSFQQAIEQEFEELGSKMIKISQLERAIKSMSSMEQELIIGIESITRSMDTSDTGNDRLQKASYKLSLVQQSLRELREAEREYANLVKKFTAV